MAKLKALVIERKMKPGWYGDGDGLYLLVGPNGAKSWVFRWQANKAERKMGLGPYPDISLADARSTAGECRKLRAQGLDPIAVREAERAQDQRESARATTFKECAEAYIAANEAGWKNDKHRQQWGSTLATYVYPLIGKLPVSAVDEPRVLGVLQQAVPAHGRKKAGLLWNARPDTAGRVRGRIELVLDWAKFNKFRDGENPARWRANLDHALPKRSKIKKVRNQPSLPYGQMGKFMPELRALEGVAPLAAEFTILNASRTAEALGARWPEIDEANAIWTIPAERMKGGREHRVPLSAPALAVLARVKPLRRKGDFVFPGRKAESSLSNMALLAVLKRIGHTDAKDQPITTHGFRSTFRDWISECTSFPSEVAEMALAHAIENDVEAAYRRGELLEKRRKLMDAWAAFCGGAQGSNVVTLPAVAA